MEEIKPVKMGLKNLILQYGNFFFSTIYVKAASPF